jgi:hypothetical protein
MRELFRDSVVRKKWKMKRKKEGKEHIGIPNENVRWIGMVEGQYS